MLLQFSNINSSFSLLLVPPRSSGLISGIAFTWLFIKAPDVRIYGYLFFFLSARIDFNKSLHQSRDSLSSQRTFFCDCKFCAPSTSTDNHWWEGSAETKRKSENFKIKQIFTHFSLARQFSICTGRQKKSDDDEFFLRVFFTSLLPLKLNFYVFRLNFSYNIFFLFERNLNRDD